MGREYYFIRIISCVLRVCFICALHFAVYVCVSVCLFPTRFIVWWIDFDLLDMFVDTI